MRASAALRYLVPLVALAVYWRAQPEVFDQLLGGHILYNLGSADQPREIDVPIALIVIAPFALRFGLPLVFKAALLLPFVATAAARLPGRRGATFDPARDLPSDDSLASGSPEQIAIDKAIAAALAARKPAPIQPFGRHDAAA